jgi:hypothetical protein
MSPIEREPSEHLFPLIQGIFAMQDEDKLQYSSTSTFLLQITQHRGNKQSNDNCQHL